MNRERICFRVKGTVGEALLGKAERVLGETGGGGGGGVGDQQRTSHLLRTVQARGETWTLSHRGWDKEVTSRLS